MSYANAWNESTPTTATIANTIAGYFTDNMKAVRERMDDIFGTSGAASINTADPYRPFKLDMRGQADSYVIGGASSWNVFDSTETFSNFKVTDAGDLSWRGSYLLPQSSVTYISNVAGDINNVTINDDGTSEFANTISIAAGGIIVVGQASCGETNLGSTSTPSIDWDGGNNQTFILTASTPTISLNNPITGTWYQLRIVQDSTGSRKLSWPSNVKWTGGFTPSLSPTANAGDIISLYYNGTNYDALVVGFNFAG